MILAKKPSFGLVYRNQLIIDEDLLLVYNKYLQVLLNRTKFENIT